MNTFLTKLESLFWYLTEKARLTIDWSIENINISLPLLALIFFIAILAIAARKAKLPDHRK